MPLKYVECTHIETRTVWDECDKAKELGKRCDGEMAFKLDDNEVPAFGSSSTKGWCPTCVAEGKK